MEKRTHATAAVSETIPLHGEDLMLNIRECQTVVNVAMETWGNKHESFVGVMDLISNKLATIEGGAKGLIVRVGQRTPKK